MTTNSFTQLLVSGTPLIDVRAPLEFEQGAFPASRNLPIMNDSERHRVGTSYKREGHDAAVALGHKLVEGDVRDSRIRAWQRVLADHPEAHLYCFRGGQRSNIAGEWLRAAGTPVPVIPGGYKHLRGMLLAEADSLPGKFSPTIVGGQTGTGKTLMLRELENVALDLEGCANHRGSAYGALPTGQPSQIDFEHACIVRLLQLQASGVRRLLIEDESHRVGRVTVPAALFAAMGEAPVVVIEEPLEARVERIFEEYVHVQSSLFAAVYGTEAGFRAYADYLRRALDAIRKRLGGERHTTLTQALDSALERHARDDMNGHRDWIKPLLEHYYDRMYVYQLERKASRIVYRGSFAEVRDYLRSEHLNSAPQ